MTKLNQHHSKKISMNEFEFENYRRYLFSIAYRMLGSVMDAEDMVQEAYFKWVNIDQQSVNNPKSYLATVITRLCLDYLKSARVKREEYIGPWLPEPVMSERIAPVDETVALADTLSSAFMVLLERLPPTERAAFLLREVFDYPYSEIAEILEKSPANCRKIVSRARTHLSPDLQRHAEPDYRPSAEKQQALLLAFFHSVMEGELETLTNLLASDAVAMTDSNGKATAARRPIYGAEAVAKFYKGLLKQAPEAYEVRFMSVNGQQGIAILENGKPTSLTIFEWDRDGKVIAIHNMRNPEKLERLTIVD